MSQADWLVQTTIKSIAFIRHHQPRKGTGDIDNLTFDFPLDLNEEPRAYLDFSISNLFYLNNIMHDVFYRYGFDEVSGNFQDDNFEKGGLGDDAVIANAQGMIYIHFIVFVNIL